MNKSKLELHLFVVDCNGDITEVCNLCFRLHNVPGSFRAFHITAVFRKFYHHDS